MVDRRRVGEEVGLGDVRLNLDADAPRRDGRVGVEDQVNHLTASLDGVNLETYTSSDLA